MKGGDGGFAGGKGPAGGCWHCGGNHYMSECPRGRGKAFQLSEWFRSGETTERAKSVVAIERVPREGPRGARGRQSSCEVLPTPTPTHVVSRPRENKVGSTPSQPQTTSGCSTL